MPAGSSSNVKGGGRKGNPSASPTHSMHLSPTPSATRIKLTVRPANTSGPLAVASSSSRPVGPSMSASASTSTGTSTGNKVGRLRKIASAQRPAPVASSSKPKKPKAKSRYAYMTSDSDTDSSDLTPDEDEEAEMQAMFDEEEEADRYMQDYEDYEEQDFEEDDDDDDDDVMPQGSSKKSKTTTPRKRKADAAAVTPARKSADKGKGKAVDPKTGGSSSAARKKVAPSGKEAVQAKVTITGPAGRERKRTVRLGEQERRRARDEKFSFGGGGSGGAGTSSASPPRNLVYADEDASSYGDDESGPEFREEDEEEDEDEEDDMNADVFGFADDLPSSFGLGGLGFENSLESMFMLPDAFAGQEVEDLAYGAGANENNAARDASAPFWQPEEDEDEDMLITHLSGSEMDRQSQSTLHSDTDELMSDSDMSDSTEDGLDEFGMPIARVPADPDSREPELVLMENWDGQFILVEPRTEKPRKRRSSRTTGGTGSVSGSTVLSANDQQGLLIDPDANEFGQDGHGSDDSSEWSGMSDEDDGGDTTDSMAEEDMPILDSPALNVFIERSIGAAAASAISPMPLLSPEPAGCNAVAAPAAPVAPLITVTDTSMPDTPALSSSSSGTPALPGPAPPQTPTITEDYMSLLAALRMPHMGTFLPTTDHPAQHAVIDGSKTTTRSPFTHKRRCRKGRAGSMSSMGTAAGTPGGGVGGMNGMYETSSPGNMTASAAAAAAKAKRRSRSTTAALDSYGSPFKSPAAAAASAQRRSARYSSIPGHPRFKAAQRRAMLEMEEETASEEEGDDGMQLELELEDMLEASVMQQRGGGRAGAGDQLAHNEQLRHLSRFDRIPVSNYLRRNFDSSARGRGAHARGAINFGARGHAQHNPHQNHDAVNSGAVSGGLDAWTSPVRPSGQPNGGIEETLAGPMGRMLVSPVLMPTGGGGESRGRRKERVDIPPLNITAN